jgi:hypothetical protein
MMNVFFLNTCVTPKVDNFETIRNDVLSPFISNFLHSCFQMTLYNF